MTLWDVVITCNTGHRSSCPAVQTSNVTQMRSQPGFLKNAHQFLFPQSPILSTFPSSPSSFTPLSRNPLSHHCLRNQHWIKKNSNLSLTSKIIERVVKSRLMDRLTSNSLLNSHQSAYCKHHSTETALLYIHDYLISAIGSQKVSCLSLLDLSAAYDTICHGVLITRFSSWFGIHGIHVHSWFKWYLSSRCFRDKCEIDLFSWYTSSCGVPKALSLVLYSSSCTLISTCSLNHHLNADDTQLFLSFLPTHIDSSIDHLHNALDRISSWMTGNLLTLYSSKTEFLLIGLSKQLAEINNSLLTPLETSASYFDKHLTFSD